MKKLYFSQSIYKQAPIFLPFLSYMTEQKKEIKNIKISLESHSQLKKYCEKHGLKIHRFLEQLIKEKCVVKKDIYGE
jgi:hypothetical protein